MARWFVDRLPQKGIPSVSLRRLLPEARFVGCHDWQVSGCTSDSRRLDPGQVFVAVRGNRHDGHEYVPQALERGAAGVVVERPCPEAGRLQVIVADSRAAHARLCQALAGDPCELLETFGVTGSCGSTVTSLFIRSIFEATGVRFGLIGALGWSDGARAHPVGRPDPGPESLAAMLAEMVEHGCAGVVIELSSAALMMRCAEAIAFDGAVVTDMAKGRMNCAELVERRRAKARLVRSVVAGGPTVVNADDPHAELLGAVNLDARRVSFALDQPADVTAKIEHHDAPGTRFLLRGFDREAVVNLRLTGSSNVSHALAAAALAWSRGLDLDAVVAGIEAVESIPGRMEAIDEGQPFHVRIDGARQAHQLRESLADLRSITEGHLVCILGSEGNTARVTRQALGEAAEEGADRVFLTSDNPRTENPDQILDDLLAGFRRPGRVRVEPGRRRAIEAALADARPGDSVLIAGKGTQIYQILADRVQLCDDRAVITRWLRTHPKSWIRSSA